MSRPLARAAGSVGAGALVAFSLPPWGWWPLSFVGFALLGLLLDGTRGRADRFVAVFLFGLAWLAPGMGWMVWLTAPGWVVASVSYAAYLGLAGAIAPQGRWRLLGLPCAVVVAEWCRWTFPFGGVPLASLAIAQVNGPFAPVVRMGGGLLLSAVTVAVGLALGELVRDRRSGWRRASVVLAAAGALTVVALVVPHGREVGELTVAAVQGGGDQGTRATSTDSRVVFARHVEATADVPPGVQLVVWPENVIDTDAVPWADSAERARIAALAAEHDAVFAVGVTEDVVLPGSAPGSPPRFTNAQIAVLPDGRDAARYDKVQRVPFGEYMPLRGFLTAIGAPTDLVPKDAVAGSGPAVLDTPVGTLGVSISWEVFFGHRARAAALSGAQVLLNPTNGASYVGSILQTQQIASSRLRALETGRWVVQAAPTGFSAIITDEGRVLERTGQRERRVVDGTVRLREGLTPYTRLGDATVLAWALGLLAVSLVLAGRQRRPAAGGSGGPDRRAPAGVGAPD